MWENKPASNKGVLLGCEEINDEDISFSVNVLKRYLHKLPY